MLIWENTCNKNVIAIKDYNAMWGRTLNENANQHNKCNNNTKIKLSKLGKLSEIWENYNYCRKLVRLNGFINCSFKCLPTV